MEFHICLSSSCLSEVAKRNKQKKFASFLRDFKWHKCNIFLSFSTLSQRLKIPVSKRVIKEGEYWRDKTPSMTSRTYRKVWWVPLVGRKRNNSKDKSLSNWIGKELVRKLPHAHLKHTSHCLLSDGMECTPISINLHTVQYSAGWSGYRGVYLNESHECVALSILIISAATCLKLSFNITLIWKPTYKLSSSIWQDI